VAVVVLVELFILAAQEHLVKVMQVEILLSKVV
jgi:hypothetical protein